MDEPPSSLPPDQASETGSPKAANPEEYWRAGVRPGPGSAVRRFITLLVVALAAFAVTVRFLARRGAPDRMVVTDAGAENVVRAQLNALRRCKIRAAYDLFSQSYRQQVPFEAFQELVAAHRGMFHAREMKFESRQESPVRVLVETHILAEDGGHYLGWYMVVTEEGRWRIEDLRWSRERERRNKVTVHLKEGFVSRARRNLWAIDSARA